jgi:protein-S-isoprenylcysteine O-methyltransferase Ste14
MPNILAALTILVLIGLVLTRMLLMRRGGIGAMHFGQIDKTDFLIPPFALFYFYLVFAAAFGFPTLSRQLFFRSQAIAWIGVILCYSGLVLSYLSLLTFGQSFRVGIDVDHPGALVTTGVFAFSRNPIYLSFGLILLGQFLVFPNWILLVYLGAAFWLFQRQVLREEEFLRRQYGQEYSDYCRRVRRYF